MSGSSEQEFIIPLSFHAREWLDDGTVGGDLIADEMLLDWIYLPAAAVASMVIGEAKKRLDIQAKP